MWIRNRKTEGLAWHELNQSAEANAPDSFAIVFVPVSFDDNGVPITWVQQRWKMQECDCDSLIEQQPAYSGPFRKEVILLS